MQLQMKKFVADLSIFYPISRKDQIAYAVQRTPKQTVGRFVRYNCFSHGLRGAPVGVH
jgi:hypothetical protein